MKKTVLLVAIVLLGFGNMFAQRGGGHPRMSVEERVNNLKKELSLTDEQTKQVTALYTDFQKKMQSSTEQSSREQMRSEREKLNKQIEELLTDEQKKALQKMQSQRKQGQRKERKEN